MNIFVFPIETCLCYNYQKEIIDRVSVYVCTMYNCTYKLRHSIVECECPVSCLDTRGNDSVIRTVQERPRSKCSLLRIQNRHFVHQHRNNTTSSTIWIVSYFCTGIWYLNCKSCQCEYKCKQCIHLYELILMHGLLLDLLLNGLDVEGVGQGDPEGVPEDGVVLGRADP